MDNIASILQNKLRQQKPLRGINSKEQYFAFELLGRLNDSYDKRGVYFMLTKKYSEAILRQWLNIALEKCPDNPRKYFFGIIRNQNLTLK